MGLNTGSRWSGRGGMFERHLNRVLSDEMELKHLNQLVL